MLEVFSALLINGKLLTLLLRFERGPLGSFLLLVCELSMSSRVCMYIYTLCIWHFHLANGHKQGAAATTEQQGIPSISLIEIVGSLKSSTYHSHVNLKYLDALMLCSIKAPPN